MKTTLSVVIAIYALGIGWFAAFASRNWRHKRHATINAPADSATKFCRDCRWAFAPPTGFFGRTINFAQAKCMHPTSLRSAGEFLVSGIYSPDNAHYCSSVREHGGREQCGRQAIHWQPRTPQLAARVLQLL